MTAPEDILPALDDAGLDAALEALLLVVDAPTDEEQLASALEQPVERARAALLRLSEAYAAAGRGIDLRRTGGGWRFYTRDAYAPYVERFLLDGQRARLTRAALETLAVVAYRQPVTRGLIQEVGTEPAKQGTLFATTELFLERLGLASLADLPSLAPLLPDIDAIDEL